MAACVVVAAASGSIDVVIVVIVTVVIVAMCLRAFFGRSHSVRFGLVVPGSRLEARLDEAQTRLEARGSIGSRLKLVVVVIIVTCPQPFVAQPFLELDCIEAQSRRRRRPQPFFAQLFLALWLQARGSIGSRLKLVIVVVVIVVTCPQPFFAQPFVAFWPFGSRLERLEPPEALRLRA